MEKRIETIFEIYLTLKLIPCIFHLTRNLFKLYKDVE